MFFYYHLELFFYQNSLLLFSHPIVSDSLWLQHPRPPCPSPSPGVCPSSCLCIGDAIQPSHPLTPLLLLPSIFPSTETFPMSRLFASDDQNTGASGSVLPVNIQGWSPLRLTGLISLLSRGLSGVFSSTRVWRHQLFGVLPSLWSSSQNHMWPLGRP